MLFSLATSMFITVPGPLPDPFSCSTPPRRARWEGGFNWVSHTALASPALRHRPGHLPHALPGPAATWSDAAAHHVNHTSFLHGLSAPDHYTPLSSLAPTLLDVHFPKGKSTPIFRNQPFPRIACRNRPNAPFFADFTFRKPPTSRKGSNPDPCTRVYHYIPTSNPPGVPLQLISLRIPALVNADARRITASASPLITSWVTHGGCRRRDPETGCHRPNLDRLTRMLPSVPDTSCREPWHKAEIRRSNPVRPLGTKPGAFCCRTGASASPAQAAEPRSPITAFSSMKRLTCQV